MSFRDDRRRMLLGALGAGASLALGRRVQGSTAVPVAPKRPRALIQLFANGGIDAGYTTDPKRRSEIEPRVSLDYGDADILERPKHRIGPLFAPLGSLVDRFAILNGVESSTVAHPIGRKLIRQMRRSYVPGAPTFPALLGSIMKERRPLDSVRLELETSTDGAFIDDLRGPQSRTVAWLTYQNPDLWRRLWTLSRDRRGDFVRQALRAHAGDRAGVAERDALAGTLALLDAMPDEAPPALGTQPFEHAFDGELGIRFSREEWGRTWNALPTLLWLLRHRLTSTLFLDIQLDFDSHYINTIRQRGSSSCLVPFVKRLLVELDRTLTPEGLPLSSEVGVLLCSELGRFPYANDLGGKDHLPEMPVMLCGPGIAPGQYGETDRRMMSTPIRRATGRPGKDGRVPVLEDIGTSVLAWFGERDPMRLGYMGEPLDFLFT